MTTKIKLFFNVRLVNGGTVYAKGLTLEEAGKLLAALEAINIKGEVDLSHAEGVEANGIH